MGPINRDTQIHDDRPSQFDPAAFALARKQWYAMQEAHILLIDSNLIHYPDLAHWGYITNLLLEKHPDIPLVDVARHLINSKQHTPDPDDKDEYEMFLKTASPPDIAKWLNNEYEAGRFLL